MKEPKQGQQIGGVQSGQHYNSLSERRGKYSVMDSGQVAHGIQLGQATWATSLCQPKTYRRCCLSRFSLLLLHDTGGIEQLGKASPGSAGRNRTLGSKMLDEIEIPIPCYEKQLWVVSIANRIGLNN